MSPFESSGAKSRAAERRQRTGSVFCRAAVFLLAALLPIGCKKASEDPPAQAARPSGGTAVMEARPASGPTNAPWRVVAAQNTVAEYETYDNGLFSMTIPKGWVVSTIGDYVHYTIRVTPPDGTDSQIFYNFKTEGYNKSFQAKKFWQTYYPDAGFGNSPVISEYTAECFFTFFSELGPLNNNAAFTFPVINDFTVVENFGPTLYGGDLLRATFDNENGVACDGLFTATVTNVGEQLVNSDPFDFSSALVDTYPLSVYNAIILSAPEGTFPGCADMLNRCLSSLQFSDAFMQGFAQQQDALLSRVKANSKINNEISDMITSSWERRSSSYDIISQKQSDATLGYERVYDTETGEIYKAYNGFTDDYSGERYKPVSDEMYTAAVNGYIEK